MAMLRIDGLLKVPVLCISVCVHTYLVRLESCFAAWTMISGRGLLALLLY
jgi:hypothetical protein